MHQVWVPNHEATTPWCVQLLLAEGRSGSVYLLLAHLGSINFGRQAEQAILTEYGVRLSILPHLLLCVPAVYAFLLCTPEVPTRAQFTRLFLS